MLADFGISRVIGRDGLTATRSFVNTQRPAGTPIYMPAEYHSSGKVSAKTDTYAFGIVLLELLTGKLPVNPKTRDTLLNELAPALDRPRRLFKAHLDARAGDWGKTGTRAALAIAAIAVRCTQQRVDARCTVADVVGDIDAAIGRSAESLPSAKTVEDDEGRNTF